MKSVRTNRLLGQETAYLLAVLLQGSVAAMAFGQGASPTSPLDHKYAVCRLDTLETGESRLSCNARLDRPADGRAIVLIFNITFGTDAEDPTYMPFFTADLRANRVFEKYKSKLPSTVYDAAHYSASALATYYRMGRKPRNAVLDVRVTQEDGGRLYGFNSYHNQETGLVTLNLRSVANASNMQYVLAHEIFHEIQHTSVPQKGTSSLQRRWWMEATAEYAAFLSCGRYGMGHARPPAHYFRKSLLKYQKPAGTLGLAADYGVENHEYYGAEFIRYLVEGGVKRGSSDGDEATNLTYFRDLWNSVCQGAMSSDFTDGDVPGRIEAFLKSRHGQGIRFQDEFTAYVVDKLFHQNYLLAPDWRLVVQDRATLAEDEYESTLTIDGSDALSAEVVACTVSGSSSRRVRLTINGEIETGVKVFAHAGPTLKSASGVVELLGNKPQSLDVGPNEQVFVLAVNANMDNADPDPIKVYVDADEEPLRELRTLIGQLERLALQLSVAVTPDEPQGPYQITATVTDETEAKQAEVLRAIAAIIVRLGCEPVVRITDHWSGPSASTNGEFEVDDPGTHTVKLSRQIRIEARGGRKADRLRGLAKVPPIEEEVTAGVAAAPENLAGAWTGNLVIVRMPLIEGLDQSAPNDDFMVKACAAAMQQLAAYKGKAMTLKVTLTPRDAGSGKMTMSVTPPTDQRAAGSSYELAYRLDKGTVTAATDMQGQLLTMTGRFTPAKDGKKITAWTLSGSWRLYGVGETGRVEAMNGTWSVSRAERK